MTREEFFERFSAREWDLLCSKPEFLDVFVAEPFNAEQAEAIVNKILDFDSR